MALRSPVAAVMAVETTAQQMLGVPMMLLPLLHCMVQPRGTSLLDRRSTVLE